MPRRYQVPYHVQVNWDFRGTPREWSCTVHAYNKQHALFRAGQLAESRLVVIEPKAHVTVHEDTGTGCCPYIGDNRL